MIFLLNIVLGILGGLLADALLHQAGLLNPWAVLLAVVIGIVVYAADLGSKIVNDIKR